MTVEQAEKYLPSNNILLDAFSVPNNEHFLLGNTAEELRNDDWTKVAQATSDYFTTGVAYLANRGQDAYLQEIGTVTWWSVNQKQVLTALSDNPLAHAVQLGVPPDVARRQFSIKTEPHVLFTGEQKDKQLIEKAIILIPPELLIRFKNNAIEGMATMAYLGSQVRDFANSRLTIDQPFINPRAWATEAHFLHLATKEYPEVEIGDIFHHAMKKYPNGLNDLPIEARYLGISGTEFQNAPFN